MRRLVTFIFTLLIASNIYSVFALELTNIGSLPLSGKKYTEWWYSGVSPTYTGTAKANSKVSVKVGNTTYDTTSNPSGVWSVASVDMKGDYAVVVSGDDASYSFTLHLGQSVPSSTATSTTTTTSATTAPVPNTGSNQIVALLFSSGVLLLSSYLYFWGAENNNTQFEKYFLDS